MMAEEVSKEKIQELQMLEQNLQSYSQQKQSFQAQNLEIDSALKELENTDNAYKIVGSIMVSSSKEKLKKELEEKKSLVEVRIKSIEKQESNLKEKFDNLHKEVLKSMEK